MALTSMTGFGRGEAQRAGLRVVVELGSVNRRQFDARVNLPRGLSVLEPQIIKDIGTRVSRGSVTCSVWLSRVEGDEALEVDRNAAGLYVEALREVARELEIEDDLAASDLLALPGIVQPRQPGTDETPDVWPVVRKALRKALHELVGMRSREGRALEQDLRKRFASLETRVVRIEKRAPVVVRRHRRLLRQRLSEAGVSWGSSDPQLMREVALFAERSDVAEEIVRLKSHFEQGRRLMEGRRRAGRSLDFLCQEMFREINTIGSKANDARIAAQVIAFKAGLDRIREQVQNVE